MSAATGSGPSRMPAPSGGASPWTLLGLLSLGLLVFAPTIDQRLLWGEECYLLDDSIAAVIRRFLDMDRWAGRPPLFYILRAPTLHLFGQTGLGMRLPSLLAQAAAVPALYLLARRLFRPRWALLASIAFCATALTGYFARESHVYALSTLVLILLCHVPLDAAEGRLRPLATPVLSLVALMTSLLLFPFLGLWGLLVLGLLARRAGRRVALAFVGGQAAVLAVAALVYRQAFVALTSRGSGLLEMGGEDGMAGTFTDNDLWISLVRTVRDWVFGHHFLLEPTAAWAEPVLPVATAAAVLLLLRRSAGPLSLLAGLTAASFVGTLAVFWYLAAEHQVFHRLEPRYFVHLLPLVVLAWTAALQALPGRLLPRAAAASLLVTLAWGHARTTLPANENLRELASTINARYLPATDRVAGPDAYFEECMTGIVPGQREELPRVADVSALQRVWVLHEKDRFDRMTNQMRFTQPPGLEEAGFTLAFERFHPPRIAEEFGQIVHLTRYDRGARLPSERRVHLMADLGAWPISRGLASMKVYRQRNFTFRERDSEDPVEARLEPTAHGRRSWLGDVELDPRRLYTWTLEPRHPLAFLPGFPLWGAELELHEFTALSVDADEPVLRFRPPFWTDPLLVDLAMLSMLLAGLAMLLGALWAVVRPDKAAPARLD